MLSLAKLGKDTGTGALPFEATKSTVERLAFSDFYFCHSISPPFAQHNAWARAKNQLTHCIIQHMRQNVKRFFAFLSLQCLFFICFMPRDRNIFLFYPEKYRKTGATVKWYQGIEIGMSAVYGWV